MPSTAPKSTTRSNTVSGPSRDRVRLCHAFEASTLALAAACAFGGPGCERGPRFVAPAPYDGGVLIRSACNVDDHSSPAKAIPIVLGEREQEENFVCPPTDVDWFEVEVPADTALLTVELAFTLGTLSPVELAYDVFRADDTKQPVAGAHDDKPGDNRSSVIRTHYLGTAGGKYFVKVRDVGDNEQDTRNTYNLTVTAQPDPDRNEPNETCDNATAFTGGGSGAIGAANDRDAYRFDIPAGSKIVQARVTTEDASPVDLKLTLLSPDGTTSLASEVDPFGEDGPTDFDLRRGLESTGESYCFIVEDDDGQDTDLETAYFLTVRVEPELDPNERTLRNDFPATATDLGGGGRRTGMIGSKADLDWYRIQPQVDMILDIDVNCPGCGIQPSIAIVYGHEDSPCDETSSCDYLLRRRRCSNDSDCSSGICRDYPGGRRCGKDCNGDIDCPGFVCQRGRGIKACVGIGMCTAENLCGVQQFTKTGEADRVRTAQPARSQITYVLVHDFQDNEYSEQTYTIDVAIKIDPDPNEPNNFYVPYPTFSAGDVYGRSRGMATAIPWTKPDETAQPATAEGFGCISYAGDIDFFRLEGGNPCQIATSTIEGERVDTREHCALTITYDRPTPALNLTYFLENNGGRTRASFRSSNEGGETVFGDGTCERDRECMHYFKNDRGDYKLVVRDFGQDGWGESAEECYHFTVTSGADFGCPDSCRDVNDRDGLCWCE